MLQKTQWMCIICFDSVNVSETKARMKIYNIRVWEKTPKNIEPILQCVIILSMCQKLEPAGKYLKLEPTWNDLEPAENLCNDIVSITKIRVCMKYQKQNMNVNIMSLQWHVLWYCQCAKNWNFSPQAWTKAF